MKKLLALFVAAMMMVCLTVTVFAFEPTPSPDKLIFSEDGKVDHTENMDAAKALDAEVKEGESALYLFDLSGDSATLHLTFKVELKNFLRALHWEDGKWVEIAGKDDLKDGVLTVTSKTGSWSPVAIITGTAEGGTTSPQTGDVATPIYVACAAVMACAAAAFVIKSKKAA